MDYWPFRSWKDHDKTLVLSKVIVGIFQYGLSRRGYHERSVWGKSGIYGGRTAKMRYARLCAMLQKKNLNVVCCTGSMFDDVRRWNRENIGVYEEIYIKRLP